MPSRLRKLPLGYEPFKAVFPVPLISARDAKKNMRVLLVGKLFGEKSFKQEWTDEATVTDPYQVKTLAYYLVRVRKPKIACKLLIWQPYERLPTNFGN